MVVAPSEPCPDVPAAWPVRCFAHSRHQQIFALIKLLDWVQKSEGWYTIYKRKLTFIVSFVPSIELGISIYYSKY